MNQTNSQPQEQAVHPSAPATAPGESGWSFPALLNVFTASLPIWMRRFGVRAADAEDAAQEARVEVWQLTSTFPAAHDDARYQMLRIAVKIAQRWRRYTARLVCVENPESVDPRDVEAWIAARTLWLEALDRLDAPSRKLLIAYHIDGYTYAEIGAKMNEKEDTIRKRVHVADKKLREELDKLMGGDKKAKRGAVALGAGMVLDPFDRAVFRAILDVEEEFGLAPPPASTVRPKVTSKPWPWQCLPTGILAIALFLVPGQGWRTEVLYAEKIGNIPLPMVDVHAATQTPVEKRAPLESPLPRKPVTNLSRPVPVLNANAAEIMNNLRTVRTALPSQ